MTQEDRRLLIKDLCGRSYYKVKVSAIYDDDEELKVHYVQFIQRIIE